MRWLIALALVFVLAGSAYAQTVSPWVSGTATATNTAATTLIAAPSALTGQALFITGVQCGRDDVGTTAIVITLNDTNATQLVLPNSGGGGGNNATFISPITPGPTTAFKFTSGTGITTVRCNAQGFLR